MQQGVSSIRYGLSAKKTQDEFRVIRAGLACLPADVKDAPASDAKCKRLLAFFKNEFFTWVNEPECAGCGSKDEVKAVGVRPPSSPEELEGRASRVEVYA